MSKGATKSGRGFVSLLAIAAVVTAGVMFSGQWRTPNGKHAPSPDEPRTLLLTVTWEPQHRKQLVAIYWTINGLAEPIVVAQDSPWGRLLTIRRGEALLLQADQLEPGKLVCEIHEKRTRVSRNEITLPGHLACGAPAL